MGLTSVGNPGYLAFSFCFRTIYWVINHEFPDVIENKLWYQFIRQFNWKVSYSKTCFVFCSVFLSFFFLVVIFSLQTSTANRKVRIASPINIHETNLAFVWVRSAIGIHQNILQTHRIQRTAHKVRLIGHRFIKIRDWSSLSTESKNVFCRFENR